MRTVLVPDQTEIKTTQTASVGSFMFHMMPPSSCCSAPSSVLQPFQKMNLVTALAHIFYLIFFIQNQVRNRIHMQDEMLATSVYQ